MEELGRLHARIASLRELRDLFRSLRALAASHVQEAQGALAGARKYVEVVEEAIVEGAALLQSLDEAAYTEVSAESRALIVACSEHGFAGAFNERLLDRAEAELEDGRKLVVIGRRGAALAEERGLAVDRSFAMATHVNGVLAVTRRVAAYLSTMAEIRVVFGSYRRGGNFEPEAKNILPLNPDLVLGSWRRQPPLYHLAPDVLLQRLATEYLLAEITRAVIESFASENGARLRVMEAADHNIGDKLDSLHRQENILRQESITSEMLDVVTGSEAILG